MGIVAEHCWEHGSCGLALDDIAKEADLGNRTVYNALRTGRQIGLVQDQGGVIRMVGPKWQELL